MVESHERAVDLFEDAADDLDNVAIRDFAASKLPVLRQHLQHARELRDRVLTP